jgi:hypothetical protein
MVHARFSTKNSTTLLFRHHRNRAALDRAKAAIAMITRGVADKITDQMRQNRSPKPTQLLGSHTSSPIDPAPALARITVPVLVPKPLTGCTGASERKSRLGLPSFEKQPEGNCRCVAGHEPSPAGRQDWASKRIQRYQRDHVAPPLSKQLLTGPIRFVKCRRRGFIEHRPLTVLLIRPFRCRDSGYRFFRWPIVWRRRLKYRLNRGNLRQARGPVDGFRELAGRNRRVARRMATITKRWITSRRV